MYKLIAVALALGLVGSIGVNNASAAPFNAADKNPNVVAFYETGPHGIVGESEFHEGRDLVMEAGKSQVFQQWFLGTSASEGLHGEHSVWRPKDNGTCPSNWIFFPEPFPEMGDYFEPGQDYCVMTHDYGVGQGQL
ncbi:MAG: hypothetical protein US86_C0003G0070 [Candidatus Daviesbacteria bacterium GW2011_GWA2_38_24]|uniref:Uncharacterized protein n=1 Tax=Candidatus Daviesbacteria bacterium GW2011_GWA2_38_24 TaxID=1618422 RepID=A0A0G0JJ42_9BACT|nr:MAG: hypothetical protein US86_C0003G0070 [Candidatus Daviesbacteria bacterium GW2011_GWA2_38_24]KKQ77855.1 MAG: hypothetical protein UT01_C0081G0003 [Candidatus Daviesbacteria bacterium GW2011_GWA1_38_7]OGE24623.1 MAG: hypothetical protein A2688_00375 [Candidatus Daviesbacteria bacterium RIFCSPHIGHO2_01_FULL_38_8]